MPDSDPLALMRRYLDAVNAGDLDAVASMTSPGYVHHSGAGDLDVDGVRRGLTYYRTAFPDLVYDVEEMLVVDGGNAVVARWTIRGTHDGPFSGSGPTHRTIASPGLSLSRIVDGRIVEDWEYGDDLAVLSDLGFRIEPPEVAETPAAG